MTLLQDSITTIPDEQLNFKRETSNTLPRARWNNDRRSRIPQSRQGTIIIEGMYYMFSFLFADREIKYCIHSRHDVQLKTIEFVRNRVS